jgi:FlaA1/EpsC-like NDP-sugar epimerase
VVGLSRRSKRWILSIADFLLLLATVWLLLSLRYWTPFVPKSAMTMALMAAAPAIAVAVLLYWRGYHEVTRFIGIKGSMKLAALVGLAALLWSALVLMAAQSGIPRSVVALYSLLAPCVVIAMRSVAAVGLRWSGIVVPDRSGEAERIPVAVFGAGKLGVGLSQSPAFCKTREVVAFIDSSPGLIGRSIEGIRVHSPNRLDQLARHVRFDEVIVALDNPSAQDRQSALRVLEPHKFRVRVLPDAAELTSGRIRLTDLRGVEARDLLGRAPVPPDPELVKLSVAGKSVMITGAGGTIGSEIARQAVSLGASTAILVDHSEAALFAIEQELLGRAAALPEGQRPEIVAVLTSVRDKAVIDDTLRKHEVKTVFHAAAFKHVPMVERHPIAGVVNNTLATESLALSAIAAGVERFVLISTDKAVRPTSVMGASKRVAELLLQDLSACGGQTVFCCVRFGNVLGSSGSVVERFTEQIRAGGPVTVTHPEMVRYFMSVTEAASLVIQAAALSKGGETFLLDMGEPIQIVDLARSMIKLMGYEECTAQNPFGDIEIVYTGLRPGEKLYEELLVDMRTAAGTRHPRIMTSREPRVDPEMLRRELVNIRRAVEMRDVGLVLASFAILVADYRPSPMMLGHAALPQAVTSH